MVSSDSILFHYFDPIYIKNRKERMLSWAVEFKFLNFFFSLADPDPTISTRDQDF